MVFEVFSNPAPYKIHGIKTIVDSSHRGTCCWEELAAGSESKTKSLNCSRPGFPLLPVLNHPPPPPPHTSLPRWALGRSWRGCKPDPGPRAPQSICRGHGAAPNPKLWPHKDVFAVSPAETHLPCSLPVSKGSPCRRQSFVVVGASRRLLIEQFLLTLMETITNSQRNRLVSQYFKARLGN